MQRIVNWIRWYIRGVFFNNRAIFLWALVYKCIWCCVVHIYLFMIHCWVNVAPGFSKLFCYFPLSFNILFWLSCFRGCIVITIKQLSIELDDVYVQYFLTIDPYFSELLFTNVYDAAFYIFILLWATAGWMSLLDFTSSSLTSFSHSTFYYGYLVLEAVL